MPQLDDIFNAFSENKIFEDKFVLQANFIPENISHRDKQIEQIASILAPTLRGERTSNLFVYGQTGTGKTLSVQFVRDELLKRAKNSDVKLRIEYLNCKLKQVADTEYRILAEMIKKLGGEVPSTGLPTQQVYNRFIELIEQEKQIIVLVLDEIDQAVKKISDNFLYNLTRLNTELNNAQICVVGISNDLNFLESLDPRVRSSLGEEELIFAPYNALQLQEILSKRSCRAFKKNVVEDGVISKCAAYAAREHGDARRALDLLRVAGELAERDGKEKVSLCHVDLANDKMDRDKILDLMHSAPKQLQLVLFSIISLTESKKLDKIFTGDIYNFYQQLCQKSRTEILTQRRVGDLIAESDMLGLINARVISKGRHGRTREIVLSIPAAILEKAKGILRDSLNL
ncbi:MAG: orc1/cdc6 family replication initiation protein [Nanoarchaeota archaeon]|nr:orc1/cdc6 family replication initiation protein [Nanoarchaeota archaeon]MBU4086108.1 orc1/cdc6 family replication initiation protein [Nanoarchaeota archaeon]